MKMYTLVISELTCWLIWKSTTAHNVDDIVVSMITRNIELGDGKQQIRGDENGKTNESGAQ